MDVRIYQTNDDGEIDVVNGIIVMDDGLESAAYLSMFGGNIRDSGGEETKHLQWWANLSESDPAKRYRSETQHLLQSIPLVPSNLRRIEDAAHRDLQWMLDTSLATSVEVSATIPKINTINIAITIVIDDRTFHYVFTSARREQQ